MFVQWRERELDSSHLGQPPAGTVAVPHYCIHGHGTPERHFLCLGSIIFLSILISLRSYFGILQCVFCSFHYPNTNCPDAGFELLEIKMPIFVLIAVLTWLTTDFVLRTVHLVLMTTHSESEVLVLTPDYRWGHWDTMSYPIWAPVLPIFDCVMPFLAWYWASSRLEVMCLMYHLCWENKESGDLSRGATPLCKKTGKIGIGCLHVSVWQNPLKCYEVISLQLIK